MHLPSLRAISLAVGCALTLGAAHAAPALPAKAYLTQQDAAARSARLANVDYVLDFTLTGAPRFAASSTVQFDLADTKAPLLLDLRQADIKSITINGKSVPVQYDGAFITLGAEHLRQGRNEAVVAFEREHSTNGEGLHRMVDPVDGKTYTYSHFEPAAAQQMFALFDQPDLKASYSLTVTAPRDWHVISTTRETAIADAGDARRWSFKTTKRLSPYNFSLHAGPYHVWEDKTGKYPLRLFARQSLVAQVKPEDWFSATHAGLTFFDKYFGIDYPFEKYDQIIVPDFLYGAMENAGAITFAEARFLGAKMTPAERQRLTEVIMHEMAHQWFGNLVTMKWWNGLWLNESFASFMATLATSEATEFKDGWRSFYQKGKQAAYIQDQSAATHPIEVPVPSTANAFDNIDAITYSKGASTLKQLRHLLGEETFRRGVHEYLVKYSWTNATLDDFIGSLGKAAGRDLSKWTQQWLYQAGVNTIAANYSCTNGKISKFTLTQKAPSTELPTLREQRVQVAAFKRDGEQMTLVRNVPVTYSGASTAVPQMNGAACPDLVYPNYEDWGFAKVELDQRSFASARTSLSKVSDPLLRAMLWQSLWDSVRDARLPLNEFIDIALANAASEQDYTNLGDVLGKIVQAKAYLDTMQADPAYRGKTTLALENQAWQGVLAQRGKPDFQRRWLGHYVSLASSQAALARVAAMLDNPAASEGVEINQELRWAMIARLSRFGVAGAAERLAQEAQRDKSDAGQLAAVAASAIQPQAQIKADWLAKLEARDGKLQFSRLRTAMYSLYPAEQVALNEATAVQRLGTLAQIDQTAGPVFMRSYAPSLIPATCTPASVERLRQASTQLQGLSAFTARTLRDAVQEDQRCVTMRAAMTVQ